MACPGSLIRRQTQCKQLGDVRCNRPEIWPVTFDVLWRLYQISMWATRKGLRTQHSKTTHSLCSCRLSREWLHSSRDAVLLNQHLKVTSQKESCEGFEVFRVRFRNILHLRLKLQTRPLCQLHRAARDTPVAARLPSKVDARDLHSRCTCCTIQALQASHALWISVTMVPPSAPPGVPFWRFLWSPSGCWTPEAGKAWQSHKLCPNKNLQTMTGWHNLTVSINIYHNLAY